MYLGYTAREFNTARDEGQGTGDKGAARKLWKIDRAALLKWLVELLGRGGHLAVVVSRRILLLILSDDLRLHVLIDRRKHVTWISE